MRILPLRPDFIRIIPKDTIIEIVRNVRFLQSKKVLLIDETGTNLGEYDSYKALLEARSRELDLILVTRTNPPVCKIGDLGKLRYEADKKKPPKKTPELKILNIRPATATHDLDTEVTLAKKFLLKGSKVKIICKFRPRQLKSQELGRTRLDYIVDALKDVSKVEKPFELVGLELSIVLGPKEKS